MTWWAIIDGLLWWNKLGVPGWQVGSWELVRFSMSFPNLICHELLIWNYIKDGFGFLLQSCTGDCGWNVQIFFMEHQQFCTNFLLWKIGVLFALVLFFVARSLLLHSIALLLSFSLLLSHFLFSLLLLRFSLWSQRLGCHCCTLKRLEFWFEGIEGHIAMITCKSENGSSRWPLLQSDPHWFSFNQKVRLLLLWFYNRMLSLAQKSKFAIAQQSKFAFTHQKQSAIAQQSKSTFALSKDSYFIP